MHPLPALEIKAFVPAPDLARSRRFYEALGFAAVSATPDLVHLRRGAAALLLQRFDVPAFAQNLQMHLLVEDADAWWAHVQASGVLGDAGVRAEPPADRPWGLRDFVLVDPAGVMWRIGALLRPTRTALVRRLWACYQARDWDGARAVFDVDAQALWWSTRERFDGAAAIVHVNAVYPEGWTLTVLDVQPLPDGRVLSLVRVDQDGRAFHGTGFFAFTADGTRIARADEYWADGAPPPAWRAAGDLPGWSRLPEDRRTGID